MPPFSHEQYRTAFPVRQSKRLFRWLRRQIGQSAVWVNLVIYFFVLVMGGAVSGFVWHSGSALNETSQQLIDHELPQLSTLSRLRHQVSEYERLLYEFYATESIPLLETELANNKRLITQLSNDLSANLPRQEIANRFLTAMKVLDQMPGRLQQALTPGDKDWDAARAILAQASVAGEQAQSALADWERIIRRKFSYSLAESKDKLSAITHWVLIFALAILMMALFFGSYLTHILRQNYEKRRLALFIEKSPTPIACFDRQCECEFTNASWRAVGFEKDVVFWQLIKGKVAEAVSGKHKFKRELLSFQEKGFEFSIQHIPALAQTMIHAEDVTERERAKQALVFKATHDELTALPNQTSLKEDLAETIRQRPDQPLMILMVNIRRLKMISMNHGHHVSDQLLKSVSLRLKHDFSQPLWPLAATQLYRYAGANFCLYSPIAGSEYRESLIPQIRDYLELLVAQPVATEFGHFYIDYAAGLCCYPDNGQSVSDLLRHLDAATVNAGKSGTHKLVAFDQSIGEREKRRFQVESALRNARRKQEFFLCYQPKIELKSGHLVGLEALIRWRHPRLGMVSPADFIPVAEESGLIIAIGEWVFNEVCGQLQIWKKSNLAIPVAVNISPTHLLSAGFKAFIDERIQQYQLPSELLEIEMTEEAYADDQQLLLSVLKDISMSGISLAIDDFGTGYSSLSYLSQLPVSTLKIDRAFVTHIDSNLVQQEIVSTVISLARSLSLKVVAEGIETESEAKVLTSLGCDIGQGYWFSKPLPADALESYLSTSEKLDVRR